MITKLSLSAFLEASQHQLIADVRTPAEFEQGHILNAFNLPLFTNEERVIIGTTFKQKGKEIAILQAFELIGPRWADFIRAAEEKCPDKKILLHCWRGGMRSASMAWALNIYGFEVGLLENGYKAYRTYCLDLLEKEYPIIILGGATGSAKTETLQAMKKFGEQVIDLELLANHQGSSFGSLGKYIQPSQEQFENTLAIELSQMNLNNKIWLENESVLIGKRVIPKKLFQQMNEALVVNINIAQAERIEFLNQVYGVLDKAFLKDSVIKISKRLGPNESKLCIQAIEEGNTKEFISLVLVYYDKTYANGLSKRKQEDIYEINFSKINPISNAKAIIDFCQQAINKKNRNGRN